MAAGVPPYPTVPDSLSTYVNGPLLVSELRDDVSNGVLFLANKPVFTGYCTTGPTLTASTWTPVPLDTDGYDNWAGHQPLGANDDRYYCQAAGWYLAEGTVSFAYTGAGAQFFGTSIGVGTVGGLTLYTGQETYTAAAEQPATFAAELFEMTRTGAPGTTGVDYCNVQGYTAGTSIPLTTAANDQPRLNVRWAGTGTASSLQVPSNAAWPVPPSYITTTWLEDNITEAIGFLANPPLFRAAYTAGGNIASGTWPAGTNITLGTPVIDNYSAYSGSTYTVPAGCGGIYYAYGQVSIAAASSAGAYAAGITTGGTTYWGNAAEASASSPHTLTTSYCNKIRLAAGATVALTGFQNTGSSLAINTTNTKMILAWESA